MLRYYQIIYSKYIILLKTKHRNTADVFQVKYKGIFYIEITLIGEWSHF